MIKIAGISSHKKGKQKSLNIKFLQIFALSALISVFPQDDNYWANAVSGKNKIFSISFIDEQIGLAESADGEFLTTSDGGKNWIQKTDVSFSSINSSSNILWQADIYCAIMSTTDGGETWSPYDQGKQDHFCGVYLRDENTSYGVASDFLSKVTEEINTYSEKNEIDLLINNPQKCTEYYRSPDEGWALGWCVKNYKK